jgi:hypothetical protein
MTKKKYLERNNNQGKKYKKKIDRQSVLCDDPQTTKKYEDICKGYGDYFEDVKDECKDKNGKSDGNRCKFDHIS